VDSSAFGETAACMSVVLHKVCRRCPEGPEDLSLAKGFNMSVRPATSVNPQSKVSKVASTIGNSLNLISQIGPYYGLSDSNAFRSVSIVIAREQEGC